MRNISLNSHDKREQKNYFPHAAYANLVTHEDVCFYEINTIDGIKENKTKDMAIILIISGQVEQEKI